MIRENVLNLSGGTIIAHDRKTERQIFYVAARMLFPKQDKDKGKRSRFLSLYKYQFKSPKIDSHSVMEDVFSEQTKGTIAGEVFLKQILISLKKNEAPSIRFLEYAVKQGFILREYEAKGYPVRQLRPIYNKFNSVNHLWCADRFIQAAHNSNGAAPLTFQYLFAYPGYYLGLAEAFRKQAVKAKLISKKTQLWMPDEWRELAKPIKLDECVIGVPKCWWDKWQSLEKLQEWYQEGQEWQPKKPKNLEKTRQ